MLPSEVWLFKSKMWIEKVWNMHGACVCHGCCGEGLPGWGTPWGVISDLHVLECVGLRCCKMDDIYLQLDRSSSHLGGRNLNWDSTSTGWVCRQVCRAFFLDSWLLGECLAHHEHWLWMIQKAGWANHERQASLQRFSVASASIPAFSSCPGFPHL